MSRLARFLQRLFPRRHTCDFPVVHSEGVRWTCPECDVTYESIIDAFETAMVGNVRYGWLHRIFQ